MKRTLLLSCLVAGTCLLGATLAQAQAPQMSSQRLEFNIPSFNGLPLHGEARGAEGLNYTAAVSVTFRDNRSVLHRLFIDHDRHVYFGYDMEGYRVEGQQQVHLHFAPLSGLSSFAGVDLSNFTPRSPALPADETVPVNSPVYVPLEVDDTGNRVLRDKLTFGPQNDR